MIGQTQQNYTRQDLYDHWKARGIDLQKPFFKPESIYETDLYRTREQDHGLENQFDHELIKQSMPALE